MVKIRTLALSTALCLAAHSQDGVHLERAVTLARQHRYTEAASELRGVPPPLAIAQRIAYHRLKAAIASGTGDPKAGAVEMESALELSPNDQNLLLATALAEAQGGLYDSATGHLETAAGLAPHNAAVYSLLGDVQEKKGDSLAAVRSYQKAVELAPDQEEYAFALGVELLRHQTLEPAILVFQKATGHFPRSMRAHIGLALAYFIADRDGDASASLLEAARIDPQSELAIDYLGEIQLTQSADPDPGAIRATCAFADAHPDAAHALAICGGLMLRSGQAEARGRLETAARLAPSDSIARCQLAKALEADQDWKLARAQAEGCARLRPDAAEAHYRLARIYRRLGLNDLAKQQDRLRSEADLKESAANERRYATASKFLYTLKQP